MKKIITSLFSDLFSSAVDTWKVGSRLLGVSYRARKSAVLLYLFGAVVETFGSVFTIFATAKLFSLLAGYLSGNPTGEIWFWLAMDTLAASLIGLGFWVMNYADRLLYFAITQWAGIEFMSAVNRIDINDFYNPEIRDSINKARQGYHWQVPNLSYTYLQLIYSVMRFCAIALVVAQISWWLIVVIAVFLIPSLMAEGKIAKVHWLIWGEKGDNRHIFSGIDDIVTKPKQQMELRSMQAGGYIINKIRTINSEFYNRQIKAYNNASRFGLVAKFFEIGGVAIGAIYVLSRFLGGKINLDTFFFVNGALFRINGALNTVFGTLTRIQEPQEFTKDFFRLIDMSPKIIDRPGARKIGKSVPRIEFENVSFNYPHKDAVIFNDLNLIIEPGEHIALVGENGAGKSTLIKLLLRFYRPTSGRITINGIDLEDIEIQSWYSQLATLFQEFNQYPFPIRENLEIARPSRAGDKKRLHDAAHQGGLDTQLQRYEHGWETVLDSSFKKGTEPSGGQWQRVALARAFYRHGKVLILDEPTSAIDAKGEYEIFNNIFDHYHNKTAIIVSHRFSTVRRANRIIVLEDGKIIEQGSHTALMKTNGIYHTLFTRQAEGYK